MHRYRSLCTGKTFNLRVLKLESAKNLRVFQFELIFLCCWGCMVGSYFSKISEKFRHLWQHRHFIILLGMLNLARSLSSKS